MKEEIKEEIIDETKEDKIEIIKEKPEEELVKIKKSDLKRDKNKKSLISRIINIILWIIIIAWATLVVTDYINVNKEKDPKFCWFNEKTTKYDDGEVTECMGIGYKVIKYNRTSFKAIEFGPFWIKDRSNK